MMPMSQAKARKAAQIAAITDLIRRLPLRPGADEQAEFHADYIVTFYSLQSFAELTRPDRAWKREARGARRPKFEQLDALDRAENLATAVRDVRRALAHAGLELEMALREEMGDIGLIQFRNYMKAIEPQVFAAHDAIEKMQPNPRPLGRPRKSLAASITELAAETFESLTGARISVATDHDSGAKSGAFVVFLEQVFSELGLDASAVAQAQDLRDRRNTNDFRPLKIGASYTF